MKNNKVILIIGTILILLLVALFVWKFQDIKTIFTWIVDNKINAEDSAFSGDVNDFSNEPINSTVKVVIYHNGKGSMCLDAIEFFNEKNISYEEKISDNSSFYDELDAVIAEFEKSEGMSKNFGFLPVIIVDDKAYSGFDDAIGDEIVDYVLEKETSK